MMLIFTNNISSKTKYVFQHFPDAVEKRRKFLLYTVLKRRSCFYQLNY